MGWRFSTFFLLPAACYLISFLISREIMIILSRHILESENIYKTSHPTQALIALSGAVLTILSVHLFRKEKHNFIPIIWVTILTITTFLNLIFGFVKINQYGDAFFIQWFVDSGEAFSRWLAGTSLLIKIYPSFLSSFLPNLFHTPKIFSYIALSGVLMMFTATALLTKLANGRWILLLPMLTPIWLIFCLGYQEYYPFVAGFFLGAIFLCFSAHNINWIWWGATAGLLPLLYVGFWPIALLLCIGVARTAPIAVIKTSILALFIFIAGVWVFWPHEPGDFIQMLISDLNLGEKNTVYPSYKGQSMSPKSIFFNLNYAFSLHHLMHLFFMLTAGIGATTVPFLCAAPYFLSKSELTLFLKEIWPGVILTGSQIFYFLLMVPKFGPIKDFDLFFTVYLTLAALLGALLDFTSTHKYSQKIIIIVLSTTLGGFIGTTAMLMIG